MSKKWSWKKILLIIFGFILLAIIIGLIVGLTSSGGNGNGGSGNGSLSPCKAIGDNCSPAPYETEGNCCSYNCNNYDFPNSKNLKCGPRRECDTSISCENPFCDECSPSDDVECTLDGGGNVTSLYGELFACAAGESDGGDPNYLNNCSPIPSKSELLEQCSSGKNFTQTLNCINPDPDDTNCFAPTNPPDPSCGFFCNLSPNNKIDCNNSTYEPGQRCNCTWNPNTLAPFKIKYSCNQCISDGEQCSSMLPNGKTINPNDQCCSGSCNQGKCISKSL